MQDGRVGDTVNAVIEKFTDILKRRARVVINNRDAVTCSKCDECQQWFPIPKYRTYFHYRDTGCWDIPYCSTCMPIKIKEFDAVRGELLEAVEQLATTQPDFSNYTIHMNMFKSRFHSTTFNYSDMHSTTLLSLCTKIRTTYKTIGHFLHDSWDLVRRWHEVLEERVIPQVSYIEVCLSDIVDDVVRKLEEIRKTEVPLRPKIVMSVTFIPDENVCRIVNARKSRRKSELEKRLKREQSGGRKRGRKPRGTTTCTRSSVGGTGRDPLTTTTTLSCPSTKTTTTLPLSCPSTTTTLPLSCPSTTAATLPLSCFASCSGPDTIKSLKERLDRIAQMNNNYPGDTITGWKYQGPSLLVGPEDSSTDTEIEPCDSLNRFEENGRSSPCGPLISRASYHTPTHKSSQHEETSRVDLSSWQYLAHTHIRIKEKSKRKGSQQRAKRVAQPVLSGATMANKFHSQLIIIQDQLNKAVEVSENEDTDSE